jgi:ABC-type cobalamin/Fe3+-siderophores transport system ATPase subunit
MKKISHEEARREISDIDKFIGNNGDGFTTMIKEYVTQQMQKDNLSQKEHELFVLHKAKFQLSINYAQTSDEKLREEIIDDIYEVDMKILKVDKDIKNLKWLYDLSDEVTP